MNLAFDAQGFAMEGCRRKLAVKLMDLRLGRVRPEDHRDTHHASTLIMPHMGRGSRLCFMRREGASIRKAPAFREARGLESRGENSSVRRHLQ